MVDKNWSKFVFTKWLVSQNHPLWKRAGNFREYLAGDWMNHLSDTVYHGLTSTNQINSRRALPAVEPVGKLNSCGSQAKEERKHLYK